jgi:hypothetical protein
MQKTVFKGCSCPSIHFASQNTQSERGLIKPFVVIQPSLLGAMADQSAQPRRSLVGRRRVDSEASLSCRRIVSNHTNARQRKFFLTLVALLFTSHINCLEVAVSFPNLATKIDDQGRTVFLAPETQPFSINVDINGAAQDIEQVDVTGLDAFTVLDQHPVQRMVSVNGNVTVSNAIELQVKALKAGLYKIGPVRVRAHGKVTNSGEYYCLVEPAKVEVGRARSPEALEIDLIPSKKEVYWGEPFDVTIRYVAHDPIYQLAPEVPEQSNFFKKDMQNKGWREILRNGRRCRVYEQVVTYLPIKAGAATVGPMKIHYSVPAKEQRSRTSFEDLFNFSFGPRAEQKEAEAAAISILVKPLPKTKQPVSLVGMLTGLDISVDKPTVQVNEPIKLQVNITGKGNLEFTEEVPLKLPEGCKVFKAKTSMRDLAGGQGAVVKTIEYVLQVNKSGRVEFPAQQLVYFDPTAVAYKTLTSQPIELFLTGEAVAQPTKTVDELAKEVTEEPAKKKKTMELAFIFDNAGTGDMALTWWLMLLLMLLPMTLHLRWVTALLDMHVLKRFKKKPSAQDLYNVAEKELAGIVAAGNAEKLYQFFVKTLATVWGVHEQEVTEQKIEQRLEQIGWSEEKIREFLGYLNVCASLHFTRQAVTEETREMLLKKSQYWVLLLGK